MKIDLSNSEWKLMNRLWQDAPMTITELTAALKEDTVDREDAIEAETETFLDKVGGLGLLMNAMVEKNALTEDDIAELSAILEKAGGKT